LPRGKTVNAGVSSNCINLEQRKLKVMEFLSSIEKKGKNKHQNYDYVSIEDVVKSFRPAFVHAGIAFRCHVEKWQIIDKTMIFDYNLSFVNVDNPADHSSVRSTSIISMINDTAPGKAAAYAVKNALTKNFLIPAGKGEDVEHFDEGKSVTFSRPNPTPAMVRKPEIVQNTGVADKVIDDLYECESLAELKSVWRALGQDIPKEVWDKALPVYKKLQTRFK